MILVTNLQSPVGDDCPIHSSQLVSFTWMGQVE